MIKQGVFYLVAVLLLMTGCDDQKKVDWQPILEGEHRSETHRARDVYRHPMETLQYFDVKPCHTVVEIWPGGAGWYTEVLAPLLSECGKLYAAHFNPNSSVAYFRNSHARFLDKLKAQPDVYRGVEMTVLEPPKFVRMAPDNTSDRVLTFRNVHNWLKAGTANDVFEAAYRALKPGGLFGVVEHRAKPGTSMEQMIVSGYVTEEKVRELAAEAGFEFVDSSEINANLLDDANHPKGVWTLPPTLRLGEENIAEYLAIGESDRMTMIFRKPDNE